MTLLARMIEIRHRRTGRILRRIDADRLHGVVLRGAYLEGADLSYAGLRGADLRGADLRGADLRGAVLTCARLDDPGPALLERGCLLWLALIVGGVLLTQFYSFPLYWVFGAATLLALALLGACARWFRTRLDRANLSGAILTRADLRRAVLQSADLSEAWLDGANLRQVNLLDANLTGAHLEHADLCFAALVGADLTGAALDRVDLRGALYDGSTQWSTDFDPQARGAVPLPNLRRTDRQR